MLRHRLNKRRQHLNDERPAPRRAAAGEIVVVRVVPVVRDLNVVGAQVFPVVEPLDVTQSDPEFRQLEVWYFALVQFDRYEVNAAWRFLRIDN